MKKISRRLALPIFEYLILIVVILLGFLVRLYEINLPLVDHHSWRQADTAAVARNFARSGIKLFYPQLDNMAPTHSPNDENSQRLYLVEFPVYNAVIALVYKVWGVKEANARLVTIFFSLISAVLLYLLGKKFFGRLTGLLSISFFAFLPFNIFFSRVILPEPMMIACLLLGIYFFTLYLDKDSWFYYLASFVFITLSVLVKPYSLFIAPVLAYLIFQKQGLKGFLSFRTVFFAVFSLLPFLMWRHYIASMPAGVPASGWLFNEENIRFSGAFFHWLIFERLDKLILTIGGLFLFLLGIVLKPTKREGWLLHIWLLGVIIYFFVFAKGNVTHDYYQIIFVPIGCLFMAKGAAFLLRPPEPFNKYFCYGLFISCCLLTVAFGYYEVRHFYDLQMGVDLAGKAVDQLTPKKALVITGDTADVTLLYNCDRFGWAIGYGAAYARDIDTIEKLRDKGAGFYVTTKVNELINDKSLWSYFTKKYKLTKRTNEYLIIDLRK